MSVNSDDKELFNKIARKYSKKDMIPSSSLARKAVLLEAMKKVFSLCKNTGTVIEIGCGVGATCRYLDGFYGKYIGLDQSDNLIEIARQFNLQEKAAEFSAENILLPGKHDDTADLILSVGVLHHIPDIDDALKAVHRLSKPGALFMAIEPQKNNPLIQLLRFIRKLADPGYSRDQYFFSGPDLVEALSRNGFTDITLEYQGFFTPVFAQVILMPQCIFKPISVLCVKLDSFLNNRLPPVLKKLSFNAVVTAKAGKV